MMKTKQGTILNPSMLVETWVRQTGPDAYELVVRDVTGKEHVLEQSWRSRVVAEEKAAAIVARWIHH